MPEWLNGLAWNASIRVTVSGVRISFSPQNSAFKMFDFLQKTLPIMAILLNKSFSNTIILYRPNKAQIYVKAIKDYIQIPIDVISTGPDRKEVIMVKNFLGTML